MITLHICQLLEDEGFGRLNESIFWEELPINKTGVAVVTRGAPLPLKGKEFQSFDIYARGKDDVLGHYTLEKIKDYLLNNAYKCVLPAVPNKSNIKYQQIILQPEHAVENMGRDENGRMIWRMTWNISYRKEL